MSELDWLLKLYLSVPVLIFLVSASTNSNIFGVSKAVLSSWEWWLRLCLCDCRDRCLDIQTQIWQNSTWQ